MTENDEYRIDGHKLIYHPERVTHWLKARGDWENWEKAKTIYPIYLEISPTGACNHRCAFCALDYMEYRPRRLDLGVMKNALSEMALRGVRSIMFAGEGEPLLYHKIIPLAMAARDAGLDIAFTTNGVLLKKDIAEQLLPLASWIKVSIDAGTAETYAKLHGTAKGDFDLVIDNLRSAVRCREKNAISCTLGAQMLVLPENVDEIGRLIGLC
ncbi:MAG: radical SAM protein, partial [Deltaproteobacteria bacterium]|nr:radical SAM protein [Deltaproteobacteria bacterium]